MSSEVVNNLLLAGVSCTFAQGSVHWCETVKTRLQKQGEKGVKTKHYGGFINGSILILREEGFSGLYKGFSAAALREMSYSSLRYGLYEPFKQLLGGTDSNKTPFWKKLCAGAGTGGLSSALANPTDVLKIRMMADEHSQHTLKYHFGKIYQVGGIKGFWKGVDSTIIRAMILNAVLLSSYDEIKHTCISDFGFSDGHSLRFTASTITGILITFVVAPFDLVRTRLMDSHGVYRHMGDCLWKTVRHEGAKGLYKGFIPQWARYGPYTVIQFLTWEKLRELAGMKPI